MTVNPKILAEYAIQITPILLSVIALVISLETRKAVRRENKPSFSIVQNLWTDRPYYELINEADSKLDRIPNPSYLMFIPSKLYMSHKSGEVSSLLVLSPVSYEVVEEQIVSGATKNQIVTSRLPISFKAKKGARDMVCSGVIEENEEFRISICTYPFLVIVSSVEYGYGGKAKRDILLSTPIESQRIDAAAYENLLAYTKDNYMHEVKPPSGSGSIYKKANEQVVGAFRNMKENPLFFGAKEGGYGFVLKLINAMITPMDPVGDFKQAADGQSQPK